MVVSKRAKDYQLHWRKCNFKHACIQFISTVVPSLAIFLCKFYLTLRFNGFMSDLAFYGLVILCALLWRWLNFVNLNSGYLTEFQFCEF